MQFSSVNDWLFINDKWYNLFGNSFLHWMKNDKFDFSIFSESWFADNQLCTLASSLLISLSRMLMSLCLKNKLASSAKRWKSSSSEQLWKSLIQIKKRRGPSTDPCGTLQQTVCISEFTEASDIICILFLRYEVNKSLKTPLIP